MMPNNEEPTPRTFVFREPRNAAELLALLQIRYQVYRESRLVLFTNENSDRVEIDPYDRLSAHYGLFVTEKGLEFPVGNIRVVGSRTSPQQGMLEQLGDRYSPIAAALDRNPEAPLPILSYEDPTGAVHQEIGTMLAEGERLVEPGRLALLPQHRMLSVSKFIVESAIALYFFGPLLVDRAFVYCVPDHRPFYRRYGFQLIPGSCETFCSKAGRLFAPLVATPQDVPQSCRSRLQEMADQFALTSSINWQPALAQQVHSKASATASAA